MSDIFQKNMNAGLSRFPLLFRKILDIDYASIDVVRTQDGGYCYARNNAGKLVPISNHIDPLQSTQSALTKMQHRIGNGLAPAVVIGLNPGFLLEIVFRHFNSRVQLGEPFRRIYVIIDSVECLAGWLKAADRTEILLKNEVEFYWHEDIGAMVEVCEKDEQRSHLFIPVSSLSESLMEKIMQPLANLYLKRQKETELWLRLNEEYYDQLDDVRLAEIFHGRAGRKPRLLMPAHSSSTVVQFSTRDVCLAFERMGWETRILRMDWDLSDWRLAKSIHEFKPDLLIFINHLRTEDNTPGIYPENMLYITWVQDTIPHLNNRETAELWNKFALGTNTRTGKPRKRDLIVGYTDIIKPFGYAEERMTYLPMIVDSATFHPRKLTSEQIEKYGCDVCFASNKGKTTEEVFETELYPYLATFNISKNSGWEIHKLLWKIYREGKTITSYPQLEDIICSGVPSFDAVFSRIEDRLVKDNIIQKIFWTLNDVIYRHIVLEWCDELGLKLNLYGKYWEDHPRFKKYAKGVIAHGEELSIAYQAAKYCLHLNSIEGTHQRVKEIMASGSRCLCRVQPLSSDSILRAKLSAMIKKRCADMLNETGANQDDDEAWLAFVFRLAISSGAKGDFEYACKTLENVIRENMKGGDVYLCGDTCFSNRAELKNILNSDSNIPHGNDEVNEIAGLHNVYILNSVFRMIASNDWFDRILKTPAEMKICRLAFCLNSDNNAESLDILHSLQWENQEILLLAFYSFIKNMAYDAASLVCMKIDYEKIKDLDCLPYYFSGLAVLEALQGNHIVEELYFRRIDEAYERNELFKDIYANMAWTVFWPRKDIKSSLDLFERDHKSGRLTKSFLGRYAMLLAASGELERSMGVVDDIWKKSADSTWYAPVLNTFSEYFAPDGLILSKVEKYVCSLSDRRLILNWLKAVYGELLLSPEEILRLHNVIQNRDDNMIYETTEALAVRGALDETLEILSGLSLPPDESAADLRKLKIEYLAGCKAADYVFDRLCSMYDVQKNAGLFSDFAKQVFIPLQDSRNIIKFLGKELECRTCEVDGIYMLMAKVYADINDPANALDCLQKASQIDGLILLDICDAFLHFDKLADAAAILELYERNEIADTAIHKYCCYAHECGLNEKSIALFETSSTQAKLEICRTLFRRNHVVTSSEFFLKIDSGNINKWNDKLDYLATANELYDKNIFALLAGEINGMYHSLLSETPLALRPNQEYVRYLASTGDFSSAEAHAFMMYSKYGMTSLYTYIAAAITPRIPDHYGILAKRSTNGGCRCTSFNPVPETASIMRRIADYIEKDERISPSYKFTTCHFKYLSSGNAAAYDPLLTDTSSFPSSDLWGILWYMEDMWRAGASCFSDNWLRRISKLKALTSEYSAEYLTMVYFLKMEKEDIPEPEKSYFIDFIMRKTPSFKEYDRCCDIISGFGETEALKLFQSRYDMKKCFETARTAYILRFSV